MNDLISAVQPYINQYGYWAVFVGVMLEDFGIPMPGETLLIVGAVLASQGQMNIVILLLTGWAGAVMGDNIGYAIGRFGGRRFIHRFGQYFFIRQKHVEYVEYFFRKYGRAVVVFARFIEIFRQLNGVVAGIGRMPWWDFLSYNALGAALWASLWGISCYLLGSTAPDMADAFRNIEGVFFLGVLVGGGSLLIYWLWRQQRKWRH